MSNKSQVSNSKGNATWGGLGAVAALIGGHGILFASERAGHWLTQVFLDLGFNPREDAIICLFITAAVLAGFGFLAGMVLRILIREKPTE